MGSHPAQQFEFNPNLNPSSPLSWLLLVTEEAGVSHSRFKSTEKQQFVPQSVIPAWSSFLWDTVKAELS